LQSDRKDKKDPADFRWPNSSELEKKRTGGGSGGEKTARSNRYRPGRKKKRGKTRRRKHKTTDKTSRPGTWWGVHVGKKNLVEPESSRKGKRKTKNPEPEIKPLGGSGKVRVANAKKVPRSSGNLGYAGPNHGDKVSPRLERLVRFGEGYTFIWGWGAKTGGDRWLLVKWGGGGGGWKNTPHFKSILTVTGKAENALAVTEKEGQGQDSLQRGGFLNTGTHPRSVLKKSEAQKKVRRWAQSNSKEKVDKSTGMKLTQSWGGKREKRERRRLRTSK